MYVSGYFQCCAEVFVSIQIPDICLCKSVECVFVKFMQGLIKHEQVQLIIQTQHQSSRALCDHWLLTAGGKHRAGARIHRHETRPHCAGTPGPRDTCGFSRQIRSTPLWHVWHYQHSSRGASLQPLTSTASKFSKLQNNIFESSENLRLSKMLTSRLVTP